MIFDAANSERGVVGREFDVCIVGSGPAGITLARRLAGRGFSIALMEGGGLEFTYDSQDLYSGENRGRAYLELDLARLRYFGGSSNHWGGWTRALDAHDFTPWPHNPMSGWPIGRSDLDPYVAEADAILDLDPAHIPDEAADGSEDFIRFHFRFSPPTRFAEKYHDEIAASERIHLVVNANLVDLRLDAGHAAVTEAVFRSFDPADPGFPLRARLLPLHRRAGESANPAQRPQPDPRGHR